MARSNLFALLVATLLTCPSTVAADIDEGLLAWYPFDEDIAEKTGNIEPIDVTSTPPIINGKFGGAVKLDGDTFVALPVDINPDLHPSITISLWVKTDPRPTDPEVEKGVPNSVFIVSESIAVHNLRSDNPYFYGRSLKSNVTGPKHTARRGLWQHVALVRSIEDRPDADGNVVPHVVSQFHSGGRMSEYVTTFTTQSMATDLYVGTEAPSYKQRRFRGAVDELRIYNRALSQDEVKSLANAKAAGIGPSLPTGPAIVDTSPLGDVNAGELSGPTGSGAPSTIAIIPKTPQTMQPVDGGAPSTVAIIPTTSPTMPSLDNGLSGDAGTTDTSALGDVNVGDLTYIPDDGTPTTTAEIPRTPPLVSPVDSFDEAHDRANDAAFRDSLPSGQDADPLAELGAIDPLTEAANPGNAPDPDLAETMDRQRDVARVGQPADWKVKRIISVSPKQGVPGDLISIRVELEKTDPLNLIPNVRVAGEGTQNYALQTLNTTTEQPTASVEKIANLRIPQDFQVAHSTSRDASFRVVLLDDDNNPLQDANLSNNAMRVTVRVFSPRVEACGVLTFWDKRWHRSDSPGSRLPTASEDTNMPLGGVEIDVWRVLGQCRDTEDGCSEHDDDELGGTKSKLSDGRFCFVVERPSKIYATSKLETDIARIERANGGQPVVSSYAKGVTLHDAPPTLDWSASCPGKVGCNSGTGRSAANSQTLAWTNTLATLIDIERNYGGAAMVSPKINVGVSRDARSACDDIFEKGNNQARPDGRTICIFTPYSNYRVAHEVGHIVMNRALDIRGNSASSCVNGSAWEAVDFEKCATTEGFANFFAAAIFWERNSQDPFYQFTDREIEGLTAEGNDGDFKACISNDSAVVLGNPQSGRQVQTVGTAHRIEGNAARFFWDLYDTTNESGESSVDDTSVSLKTLVDVWSDFDSGTSERQAEEGGRPGNRSNGRNAWDYVCQFPDARSELLLNCLDEQDGKLLPNGGDNRCTY